MSQASSAHLRQESSLEGEEEDSRATDMGLINIESLLSPVSESAPAGENLEYDAEFAELERTAEGKPERRIGNASVPAEPPDWPLVIERGLALFGRTRDLRIAVHLTHALLRRGGYAGLAEGLTLVAALLETFWATGYPELDAEDDNDPTMRVTALSALCSSATVLAIRATPLAQARGLGAISLRDVQALAAGDSKPAGPPTADSSTVEGVFQEGALEALEALEGAVGQCVEALDRIDTVFETHTGTRGPDLTPLRQVLKEVQLVISPRLTARREAAAGSVSDAGSDDAEQQLSGATAPAGGLGHEIRCREDVVRAIDRICAYYARWEPTSPLPLLLERCRRLVSCSFLEIIQDLAPDCVAKVNTLAGRKPE